MTFSSRYCDSVLSKKEIVPVMNKISSRQNLPPFYQIQQYFSFLPSLEVDGCRKESTSGQCHNCQKQADQPFFLYKLAVPFTELQLYPKNTEP